MERFVKFVSFLPRLTIPFYHFLFSRYLDLTKSHFSSDILVPFPNSSDLYSHGCYWYKFGFGTYNIHNYLTWDMCWWIQDMFPSLYMFPTMYNRCCKLYCVILLFTYFHALLLFMVLNVHHINLNLHDIPLVIFLFFLLAVSWVFFVVFQHFWGS